MENISEVTKPHTSVLSAGKILDAIVIDSCTVVKSSTASEVGRVDPAKEDRKAKSWIGWWEIVMNAED